MPTSDNQRYDGWYAEHVYPYEDIEGQLVNASGRYTINELETKDITFY